MTKKIFQGFYADSVLPYKPGDRVRIPKGSQVRDRNGTAVLARAQTVRVDHLLNGSSVCVGYRVVNKGEDHLHYQSSSDLHTVREKYGTDDLNQLTQHLKASAAEPDRATVNLWLPLTDPEVRWAGAGVLEVCFDQRPGPRSGRCLNPWTERRSSATSRSNSPRE